MNKKQEMIIKGILDNERCNMCNNKVTEKCLSCLLENSIAGYCIEHHGMENHHKPIWVGAYE